MKFLYLLFLTLTGIAFSQSQILNPDFENWSLSNSMHHTLDQWNNNCFSEDYCQQIDRTATAYSGNYALQFFNIDAGSFIIDPTFSNFYGVYNAAPFTERPETGSFYYKYNTDDHQEVYVNIMLYTGALYQSQYTVVGNAKTILSSSTALWTKATLEFEYVSSATPQFAYVTLGFEHEPSTALDTLTIDKLEFNYVTAGKSEAINNSGIEISVGTDHVAFSSPLTDAMLVDTKGTVVASSEGNSSQLPIASISPGFYALKGMFGNRVLVRWIAVQ